MKTDGEALEMEMTRLIPLKMALLILLDMKALMLLEMRDRVVLTGQILATKAKSTT